MFDRGTEPVDVPVCFLQTCLILERLKQTWLRTSGLIRTEMKRSANRAGRKGETWEMSEDGLVGDL